MCVYVCTRACVRACMHVCVTTYLQWLFACCSGYLHDKNCSKYELLVYIYIHTVQSNYNFTLTRIITRVHTWLHGKSCRGPRYMAACATATALSHVSMRGNYSYMAISAVMAACPKQLDAEGIHRIYIDCTC